MTRSIMPGFLLLPLLIGLTARRSPAQVSLADDIIIAAQGKENAERNRATSLGRVPGATAPPYARRPGSSDILLGQEPNRRLPGLPRLTQAPVTPARVLTPGPGGEAGPGRDPGAAIQRLRLPPALPPTEFSGPFNAFAEAEAETDADEGPPDGLTLDAAIDRLVHCNRELRFKALEIPQAEADVLTASLRENPLLFYSSDSVPYGSYSPRRPGEISHGLSIVLPLDYSGKRRARMTLAEREKCVLEAQYRNAVRLAIDELDTAFVDALARRQEARSAEQGVKLLDRLINQLRSRGARDEAAEDALDDLLIERELATIAAGDQRARYHDARLRVAVLLDLSPEETDALELRGAIRDAGPRLPPLQTLITIALENRPDLAAHRLGVSRAQAELGQERAERFSDAYLLYTPFLYRDNSQVNELSSTAWGAGVFVSIPLFNQNQGNIRRAHLNIAQSQAEASAMERQVIAEVRRAASDFEDTYEDAQRLSQTALPAVRRKRDRSWRKYQSGTIDTDAFLSVQRDGAALLRYHRDTLARHRQNALKVNTAVGFRIFP